MTVQGLPAKPLFARCSQRFGSTTPGRPARLRSAVESAARWSVLGSKGRTLGTTVTVGRGLPSAVAVERTSPAPLRTPIAAARDAERHLIREPSANSLVKSIPGWRRSCSILGTYSTLGDGGSGPHAR